MRFPEIYTLHRKAILSDTNIVTTRPRTAILQQAPSSTPNRLKLPGRILTWKNGDAKRQGCELQARKQKWTTAKNLLLTTRQVGTLQVSKLHIAITKRQSFTFTNFTWLKSSLSNDRSETNVHSWKRYFTINWMPWPKIENQIMPCQSPSPRSATCKSIYL